ncbi:HSP20-like chaperone [Artomyces pyxidatus]|uniref:HSP20-like chaperone n=1 Tax=Artomyces pyxidatus TaxID=48021 RepID=A0ACB8TGZ9_9AGAM|nr:HSP20-like chaperone [Artomyces pyxidatus]
MSASLPLTEQNSSTTRVQTTTQSDIIFGPLYSLSDFDNLFQEALNTHERERQQHPHRMDVYEVRGTDTVTAAIELPGLKKEDVEVVWHNNILTISGETKEQVARTSANFAVRERRYGRFVRSVPLPQGIQDGQISASMEDGLLTVTFPNCGHPTAPKRINVV